jgi:tetraacyldisaccharide 4'-kinase
MSLVEQIWHGDGAVAVAARALLSPAAMAFGTVVRVRNARFDRGEGVLPVALPVLSVGNLTVGGTGKTPLAAWCTRALQQAGARPAVVLRGYGDDEWRVHTLLSPSVPVITDVDRVRGIETAREQGADCVVLDDGFQHRRAQREADVVLVSADAWDGAVRLLPAGPFREPLAALRRAAAVVVTVKTASRDQVAAVRAAVAAAAPTVPVAVVGLVPDRLHAVPVGEALRGEADVPEPIGWLSGRSVLAVSAIAQPAPFERALRETGAMLTARRFPDHYAFSAADVASLVAAVPSSGVVVCTLKDAVKLAPLWPRATVPLWYVSQTIVVQHGAEALAGAVQRILAAREAALRTTRPTAG